MSSNQTIQLVVLAAIAIFLILRLRGVLGTRDGFEPSDKAEAASPPAHLTVVENHPEEPDDDIADHVDPQSPAAAAIRAMRKVEPNFAIGEFLSGARQAYEMILMGFETGNLAPVRGFLAPPVADAFQQVIDARESRGETAEAEFAGTSETSLVAADFDDGSNRAEITIRFVGELIVATRDKDGTVIDGDPNRARKQRDTWTFSRRMGDADPNWQLIATG